MKAPEPRADAQWEMVIPRMARPTPQRASMPSITARAPETKPPEAPKTAENPASADLSFYTLQESFLPRRWKLMAFAAVAVVAIGLIIWVRPTGSESNGNTSSAQPSAGAWSRRTAYLVGSREPREIVVYDGSNGLENYRIDFGWVPEANGVGWIFRAQDSANYYAAKIRLVQPGITPTVSVEHFVVFNGVEGSHFRKMLTLNSSVGAVPVRLDASGPTFTLYLEGKPVDYWNDSRYSSGSLGFYEDRGARPVVQTLRFTFQRKNGPQTVLASLE